MEIQFQSFLTFASLLLPILVLFKLGKRFITKKSTSNLPPGPWKLPFIGNLHNLIGSLPHHGLHSLALKYGPLMHLHLGELSTVIVSSPEVAKEIMKTHDINFASRPWFLAAEIVSYNSTSISFSPYGDYWRQLRKICTLELLSMKRVQSFRSIREQVFSDLIRSISSNEGSVLNLTETLYSSSCDVIAIAALGKKTKEQENLVRILEEIIALASGFDIGDLYPSIKLFQMISGLRTKLTKLHHQADRILEDIIHEHKLANAAKSDDDHSEGNEDRQEDLVDVLLKYQDDGLELPLTNDNIKSVLVDILGGGSETSATTMDWAMAELLKNPQILKKAQDEVRGVFDEKGYVDESNFHQLKYLKSVIKETLRLHPPAPLLLPRKCSQKCEINGYEIPINTKVIINAWAINRDPRHWEDADVFKPERFLDSLVDYKGNSFEYIPFGAGRRMCPGISFGLANVEVPLAMFLYHLDWNLPCGIEHEDMDMTDSFGSTVRRKTNLCVVPIVRRALPAK